MTQGHSFGGGLEKDEVLLALGSAFLPMLFRQRGGHGAVGADGTQAPGFLSGLLTVLVRVWEEKGGSMKDESEMLESIFADSSAKNVKLSPIERKKVSAVLGAMTPTERNVFRIAIFIMNPEVTTIETAGKTDKDGKVGPSTTRTEKTGIDPRVNVLCGIAEMVDEDMGNVDEVAKMLRNAGALGGDNASLKFLGKAQEEIKKILCRVLGVDSIEEITIDLLRAKGKGLLSHIEVPDPTQPRPNDNAGWYVRFMRSITPGSFPNPPSVKEKWFWQK